jgi:hypothetical protein
MLCIKKKYLLLNKQNKSRKKAAFFLLMTGSLDCVYLLSEFVEIKKVSFHWMRKNNDMEAWHHSKTHEKRDSSTKL